MVQTRSREQSQVAAAHDETAATGPVFSGLRPSQGATACAMRDGGKREGVAARRLLGVCWS